MNGVFNILAALLLAGIVVGAGYALSKDGANDQADSAKIEELAQRTLAEAEARYKEDTSEPVMTGLEAPYSTEYAASPATLSSATLGSDSLAAADMGADTGKDSARSLRDEKPVRTAMLGGDPKINVSATAGINTTDRKIGVDKKDSNQYFTEGRRIDKPDTLDFYTENEPLPQNRYGSYTNPCLREDGSLYTGPGTVMNPFADSNPCLVAEQPPMLAESSEILGDAQPIENLPAVEYYPLPPAQPIEIAHRCEYRSGGYTADPINDGRGNGWLADFGCFSAFPPGGFGPQPTLGDGGSDYSG